jgi:phage gp29-like protein
MAEKSTILDARGQPMQRATLKEEVAGASITGVRSPLTGYPGNGLTPVRLASILLEADKGNPIRFLELAEAIEERDPHLIGVLGTRKRSVSQLDITVDAASDAPEHQKHADLVRDWLKRDELSGELFDILDAIHKGYSFTEIMWDTSEGQWQPARLEYRDPRWFDFERADLRTPQLIDDSGQRVPLPGGKFIYAPMPAKSGIPTRGGLARVLAWAWMFKAFTNRDWAIFTQTYGQPIRVGKYGQGASSTDKDALFRAVANIAGDCAAIIPESMKIEFVEAGSVGANSDLYKSRADFFDQQTSKAVLGQTATTDAIAGGHAVGQEHRQVQEDIERADAKQLAAAINRDLVRVWIDLQFGPQKVYPKIRIGRPEQKDVKLIVESVSKLQMPVKASEIYAMLGLSEPSPEDHVLQQATPAPAVVDPLAKPVPRNIPVPGRLDVSLHQVQTPDAITVAVHDILGDDGWAPVISPIMDGLAAELASAVSVDEVKAILKRRATTMGVAGISDLLAQTAFTAWLAGDAEEVLS